jgi:hypothetical protein
MRRLLIISLLLSVSGSAGAQAAGADQGKPDGGVTVKGWQGRIDPGAVKEGMKLADLRFAPMGDGMHVTTGPAAIFWSPSSKGEGSYTVTASFTQTKAPEHAEFYGVFMGGSDLEKESQNYLYCLVSGTGVFLVKHRYGNEMHDLQARTVHAAITKADAAGKATNAVAWRVTPERTSCLINGKEVWGYASKDLLGPGKLVSTDGIAGIRVNHNLDVHVSGFAIAKP